MAGSHLDDQHADPPPGRSTGEPTDREDAQQRRDRAAHAPVPAARRQRTAIGEDRSVGNEVEDHVVRVVAAREVVGSVVDHVVGTERPHVIQLAIVVDARHVGAESLGELDRERSRAATGAVDQHPPIRRGSRGSLQRDHTRLRDRRRLDERELGRLARQRRLRCQRVLGEAAHQRQVVAVHLVAGSERGDARAHRIHDAGDVGAERPVLGRSQPADARVGRRAAQTLPIAQVDRRRRDLDEHLTCRRRRNRHVVDPQNFGSPVLVVDDGLHASAPAEVVAAFTRRTIPGGGSCGFRSEV